MDLTRSSASGAWRCVGQQADFRWHVTARDDFSDYLLHTGVIISTNSTSEWPITSVLGLQREETRINCGFHWKKTSCTVENGGVHWKKKLYGGCNA